LHSEFISSNNILNSVKDLVSVDKITVNEFITAFNEQNNVPEKFLKILKKAVYD